MDIFGALTKTHEVLLGLDPETEIDMGLDMNGYDMGIPVYYSVEDETNNIWQSWGESVALEIVFWYNRQRLQLETLVSQWTASNSGWGTFVRGISRVFEIVVAFIMGIWNRLVYNHMEPSGNWVHSAALVRIPGKEQPNAKYKLLENYETVDSSEYSGKHAIEIQFELAKNTLNANAQIQEILLMAKHADSDSYFVRSCADSDAGIVPFSDRETSTVEFLGIEYRHPKIDKPIAIQLPKSMYIVGNELLSAAFILRWLEYQPLWVDFMFDLNYTITLIDQNIEEYTIQSDEYVVLGVDTFKIHHRSDGDLSPSAKLSAKISAVSEETK